MAFLPARTTAPDIGECIYCGTLEEPLTKEHAVPYGLNGPWTLLRASCASCARITSHFERDALRSLLPALRTVLAMQTRNPKRRERRLPLVLETDGVQQVVDVPVTDFPTYLPTPIFHPPGAVTGPLPAVPVRAEHHFETIHFRHIAGPSFESISSRYPGATFLGHRVTFAPDYFLRMIAKIGFCAAVYALGISPLRASAIRRVILGTDPHVAHWVGQWPGEPMNANAGLHSVQVRASGSDLHVVLRLFAQFEAPDFHIVLGAADPAFVASAAWPFK